VSRIAASCVLVVVWHDRAYLGFSEGPGESDRGRLLQDAVLPDCNDSGGPPGVPTAVAAHRIAGISPDVAIASEGEALVGAGYVIRTTELPIGWTGRRIRDETRGCTLGDSVQVVGRARLGVGLLDVSVDRSTVPLRGAAQVFPDGHTRFEGLSRNGLPSIGVGQRIRVDARFCKVEGSTRPKIVARRITPAGPIAPPWTAEDVLGADWRGGSGVASRATGGRTWAAYAALAALALAACVGGLLIARRRSPKSGTG